MSLRSPLGRTSSTPLQPRSLFLEAVFLQAVLLRLDFQSTTMSPSSSSGSMSNRLTLAAYLAGEETVRPQELTYGLLREPPAPGWHHQMVVGRLHVRLERHVRRYNAGYIVVAPVDVILDAKRALVVQPDLVFVSAARAGICTDRIWGAPDLAIEVLSKTNRRHDGDVKVKWYRQYGVRECWLVDPAPCRIEVIDLAAGGNGARLFEGRHVMRSTVLPRLRLRPADVLID